jgi:hypothetical protein
MNEAQRRKIKDRQRAQMAAAAAEGDEHDGPPPEPPPPPRPIGEIVTELRAGLEFAPGLPVSFLRFTDKSFQVAGMQSGDNLQARTQPNGREHRIELLRELNAFLVIHIDPAKRAVEFDVVERSAVKTWRLA